MAKMLFISGTGTDVGKTYFSGLLLKGMLEKGLNAGYYKPIVSGGLGDVESVLKVSGLKREPEELNTYCFPEPVSPELAARKRGLEFDFEKIKNKAENLAKEFDYLIIEGAGGLGCPLKVNSDEVLTYADFAKNLSLPTLLVAPAGLGCLSDCLAYKYMAEHHGINLLGFVLSRYNENDDIDRDNAEQLPLLTKLPILAKVLPNAKNVEFSALLFAMGIK
ncbi:MAG: dethiobiotin synthase [Selenomonadaceae bacterium]|nr:dethiobiotin synthase [Selenomonadaceae bacterium]